MKQKYLLDTNILSEILKPKSDSKITDFLEKNDEQISTCSLVIHEIKFGIEILSDSKKKKFLNSFLTSILDTVPIFDYTVSASLWHAKERARLNKVGKAASFVDGQIASIAAVNELILVTKNSKDFKPFPLTIISF
jgi:tRNA(fMet)-specific endonuclease VapC